MDKFARPKERVTDFRTRYSGIRPSDIKCVAVWAPSWSEPCFWIRMWAWHMLRWTVWRRAGAAVAAPLSRTVLADLYSSKPPAGTRRCSDV